MALETSPENRGGPPAMKRSHFIRIQRERYSEDLPLRIPEPTARPDDTPQQPNPPKKRLCLAPSNQAPHQNPTRRIPRGSNHAKVSHSRAPASGNVQGQSNGHMAIRKPNVKDILTQLEESYQDRRGPTLSQPRTSTRIQRAPAPAPGPIPKEAPSSSTEIQRLGKHFRSSSTRGPRAEDPIRMGRYLHSNNPSAMEAKCKSTNQFDFHAYRKAIKPAKIFTYCDQCKGVVANCPLCGMMMAAGETMPERPSAHEMIRQNSQYYAKIFNFEDKIKPTTKPPKNKREPTRPPVTRLSLYPDGKRPDWDTPPEKGPEYTSWNPYETPVQTSLWDEATAPQAPTPEAPKTKKPILAAQRPKDKISEPFLRQRPESNTGKVVCFKCWDYGHVSKDCPKGYATNVEEQEIRRVLKPFHLVPAWEAILRGSTIEPMTVEEALRRKTLLDLDKPPNGEAHKEDGRIPDEVTRLLSASPKSAQAEAASCRNAPVSMMAMAPKIESESINHTPDSSSESERFAITEAEGASDLSTAGLSSSKIPSDSFFQPDNARYKPVSKGVADQTVKKLSPITKIPNEIITTIIRMLLENDTPTTRQPMLPVYEEESSLKNRNLQLDSVRKINTLWRSLCQSELYRSVPMTSSRTLRQFADCVARYPNLSKLVKEVKIYIPFVSVDGWTPSGATDEKFTITMSAKCLSLIIAACPNLSRLDASFAGVLQSLSYLTKAHSAITHLSLDDWLPRKNDFKNLGKSVSRFPKLQLLQLEAHYERPAEWRRFSIIAGDFLNRGVLLTSIGFKDFPIHDEFLEKALPNFPSLRTLQIERCPGVSPKGLANTIMNLESPRLSTLVFVGFKTEANGCHTGGESAHLCEAIATKLGSCLTNLTLISVPVCEKLGSSSSNWSQLQALIIGRNEFQGCELDTAEADIQKAMAVSGLFNLQVGSFIFYGVR
ncbi:hypothetical protein TWF481_011776 [Arthrobotrys musiformis]|uniref:CCHC-type domain-containing protein n=1 Tax=Arthrobotrys musiformis TaxID=47236 RepID=A0AAV9VV96_9PEZI